MAGMTIFANEADVLDDLALYETIIWSKAEFTNRIVAASVSDEPELVDELRIESMYHFCEFFYLLKARGIDNVELLEHLAMLHNDYLAVLSRDKTKMRRLQLSEQRLLKAFFTVDTLPRLLDVWRDSPGQIDLSNLSRFLVTIMSTETCRNLTKAAASAGFLDRVKSPYGTVVLRSTGVMEEVFGGVLRDLRQRISAIG